MALSDGRITIPTSQYPDQYEVLRYQIDRVAGPTADIGTTPHIWYFDRVTIVDKIVWVPAVATSSDESSALDARFEFKRMDPTDTSLPGDGVNLVATINVEGSVVGTPEEVTIDTNENRVKAGGALVLEYLDTSVTTPRGEFVVYARPWET